MAISSGNRTKMDGGHGKYMVVLYTGPCSCGGDCLYCIKSTGVTRSTIPNEDTLLAAHHGWSASAQLRQRCADSGLIPGTGNKFELRIKGNSFTNYDPEYLEAYIKDAYDHLNGFSAGSFEEAFRAQEKAGDKCVQIVIETRPDQINEAWCERMLRWGVRTVEIGVQSLNDDVLTANNRGHGVETVRNAAKLIRRYGFELGYQVMLGLYGSSREIDGDMLCHGLWTEEHYPDSLKIYPCLLLLDEDAQRPLYDLFHSGKWRPIGDAEYDDFLREVLPYFPRDVHVNRLQRILREDEVAFGPKKIIDRRKYREISCEMWQRSVQNTDHSLENEDYSGCRIASYEHGDHVCIQALLPDETLLGYARLSFRDGEAMLRDIRTLGRPLGVGCHSEGGLGVQHIGIGSSMLEYAEKAAFRRGCQRLVLNSSAGCTGYFKSRGYIPENHFRLAKLLKND